MKHKIRKTVYPILCRFRKKVSFDLFGWTACWSKSFKADWSSWICMKALLLKRTSQQGEIELPPESTKLKSESDFWRYFRISCHARWEIKRETLIYSHIFTFFWFLLCGIIWCRGPVTQNGFTLFIVLCLVSTVSMTVRGPVRGSGLCQIPGTRDCGTWTLICAKGDWALLCFAKQIFLMTTAPKSFLNLQTIFLMSI